MKVAGGWWGSPNNQTGGGYGIRISPQDREQYFDLAWASVTVVLDGQEEVTIKITSAFWRKCNELRSKQIGAWMLREGLAPWPTGEPPRLKLEPQGDARFRLYK